MSGSGVISLALGKPVAVEHVTGGGRCYLSDRGRASEPEVRGVGGAAFLLALDARLACRRIPLLLDPQTHRRLTLISRPL